MVGSLTQIRRFVFFCRIKIGLFEREFPETANRIDNALRSVTEAATEIRESSRFRSLLAIILRLSNYLNHGSRLGDSYGLQIEDICKIDSVKSVDNKQSLLQYLLSFVSTSTPDINCFLEDLTKAEEAHKIEENYIITEIKSIEENLCLLRSELAHEDTARDKGSRSPLADGPREWLGKFLSLATERHAGLKSSLEKAQLATRSCASFFGCDPDIHWEDMFEIFARFCKMYRRCQVNMARESETEGKKQARRLANLERLARRDKRMLAAKQLLPLEPVTSLSSGTRPSRI